ncbi:MAG TPA: hypothetical protein VH186_20280 [Chloroflexia bacterium]|nr:hypothetical protein [Chloroflexia bacterium]
MADRFSGNDDKRNIKREPGDPGNNTADVNFDSPDHNDFNAFPSERQEQRASNKNEISYSPSFSGDPSDAGVGNPNVLPPDATGAGEPKTNTYRNNVAGANQGGPVGRGFNTGGNYPSPGTATDRGYGNVGNTPYGTGIGETDLGSNTGQTEDDMMDSERDIGDYDIGASPTDVSTNIGTGVPKDRGIADDSLISGRNQDESPTMRGGSGMGPDTSADR